MNLLIDRIENPGHRNTAPLIPSVSRPTVQGQRRATNNSNGENVSQERRSIDVPVISVNGNPVPMGMKTNQKRNSVSRKNSLNKPGEKELPHERRGSSYYHGRHSVAAADVTSATAGMFSDCMFRSETQKPVRHSPSSTASSSSTSIYAHKHTDQQPLPLQHRRHHGRTDHHHNNSSTLHRKHAASFSSVFVNDNKRLVNQFLRSMEPSTPASRTPRVMTATEPSTPRNFGPNYETGTSGSLQSLLYRDLASMHSKKKKQASTLPFAPSSVSSSSNSSSFSLLRTEQSSPSLSSGYDSEDSLSITNDDKVAANNGGLTTKNGLGLNYNEVDYYRHHIAAELHKFEDILKHNIKEVIMRSEFDMVKNWKLFDMSVLQLARLQEEVSNLHDLIKEKNLQALRKDFDKKDKDSFICTLEFSIKTNASLLEGLEKRIDVCKKKLLRQRETLRKLEGLLNLEDSLLNSQKTTKIAYKYRYMVYDVGALMGIICIIFIVRWFIWR